MSNDKHIECSDLSAESLLLYAYGELKEDQAGQVKAHLDDCAKCRAELQDIRQVRGAAIDPDMPDQPGLNILNSLQVEARAKARKMPFTEKIKGWLLSPMTPLRSVGTLAAAVLLVIAVGRLAGYDSRPAEQTQPQSYDLAMLSSELDDIEKAQQELWGASDTSTTDNENIENYDVQDLESEFSNTDQGTDIYDELSQIEQELDSIGQIWEL